MGKYKRIVLDFMREKNRIIRKLTGLVIATKRDLAEIETEWAESQCEEILAELRFDSDSDCCPWCIPRLTVPYHRVFCGDCKYAKRNGSCDKLSSRYKAIRSRLMNKTDYICIAEIPEIQKLVAYTRIEYIKSKYPKSKAEFKIASVG